MWTVEREQELDSACKRLDETIHDLDKFHEEYVVLYGRPIPRRLFQEAEEQRWRNELAWDRAERKKITDRLRWQFALQMFAVAAIPCWILFVLLFGAYFLFFR